jgi:hypothetical protein
MKKKFLETEVYVIDFINKSKVFSMTLNNTKPNKKAQEQIGNAIEMLVSIKSARELPKVS